MQYVFGWMHGKGIHMLYVWETGRSWGVTPRFDEATRYASVQECVDMWRSKHRFPADFEHCVTNGYLHYFTETGQQVSPMVLT